MYNKINLKVRRDNMDKDVENLIKIYEYLVEEVSFVNIGKLIMYLTDFYKNGSVMEFESESDW